MYVLVHGMIIIHVTIHVAVNIIITAALINQNATNT